MGATLSGPAPASRLRLRRPSAWHLVLLPLALLMLSRWSGCW